MVSKAKIFLRKCMNQNRYMYFQSGGGPNQKHLFQRGLDVIFWNDPLGVELTFNPFNPKSDLIDFTLSSTRQFYLSKGDHLGVKGLRNYFP